MALDRCPGFGSHYHCGPSCATSHVDHRNKLCTFSLEAQKYILHQPTEVRGFSATTEMVLINFRVNVGGKLDVICFDKTGTLTDDGLDVLGVRVVHRPAMR